MMRHEDYLQMALDEARQALSSGDVPVGAVAVWQQQVIARQHNRREQLQDPTAHAELLALRQAAAALNTWHLEEVTLYVTLEPCAMCAGAIVLARLGLLVFGADDPKAGACGSIYNIVQNPALNHQTQVIAGVMATDCTALLKDFFAAKR